MLVISRCWDEEIVMRVPGLNEPIVVKIVSVRGGTVRLGLEAPRCVNIVRREIDDRPPLPAEAACE